MKRITRYGLSALLLAGVVCSCDRPETLPRQSEGYDIGFQGLVKNTSEVRSRSEAFDKEDFVLINSSSDAMFGQISICRVVGTITDLQSEYVSSDGMEGRLQALSTPLVWASRDAEHTFYAWTHPNVAGGGGVEMDGPASTQGKVTFGMQKETHLEQFIAAEEGPLTYEANGLYVKLLFYRPVAKIQIESLTHISATGSLTPVEKCRLYFPNLYRSARFDAKKTRPEDGNPGDIWLEPGDPGYEEPATGLTWEWDISDPAASPGDELLYVHPFQFGTDDADGGQPDETKPGYFIITAEIDGVEKTYFASLAGLVDTRELQAGQFMKMQIAIQDGSFGGVGCQIVDWNTSPEQTTIHRRAGIYSQADADALLQILQSEPLDEAALAHYCRDGNTIVLYTPIDWSSLTGPLTLPDGYRLDGQDYYVILGEGGSLEGQITNLLTPDGESYPPAEP